MVLVGKGLATSAHLAWSAMQDACAALRARERDTYVNRVLEYDPYQYSYDKVMVEELEGFSKLRVTAVASLGTDDEGNLVL